MRLGNIRKQLGLRYIGDPRETTGDVDRLDHWNFNWNRSCYSTGVSSKWADRLASMRDTSMGASLESVASSENLDLRVLQLDVEDDDSVNTAFQQVGDVDVLINNAGLSPIGSVEEFQLDAWKQLFETNVFGLIRCTQAALPTMRDKGFGHIINISSVAGRVAIPMFGPYSSSKWAVEALTETLACEASIFGIHVSLVEPGAVATPIREKNWSTQSR